jgi:general secretion pathway protein B
VWILAGLLAINVAVLLGILLRPQPEPPPATPAAAVIAVPTPAAESTSEPATSFEDRVSKARAELAEREQSQTSAAPVPDASTEQAPAQTAAAAPRPASAERIRTIDELRLSGELQMAELHLDIHVYSENPADRFVFVNMVKHREQSRLDQGPVVSEITPDGVILAYEGKTFLLPRQ